jgi:phosphatidylglycerophosphatase A
MSDSTLSKEPTFSWMIRHPARILALGFGSGLLAPAPGTWGTVFAWVSWVLFLQNQSVLVQGIVVVLTFALGGWACHLTGKHLGVADHSAMVIDEVVAFWLMLWLVPSTLLAQGALFCCFVCLTFSNRNPFVFLTPVGNMGLALCLMMYLPGFMRCWYLPYGNAFLPEMQIIVT